MNWEKAYETWEAEFFETNLAPNMREAFEVAWSMATLAERKRCARIVEHEVAAYSHPQTYAKAILDPEFE